MPTPLTAADNQNRDTQGIVAVALPVTPPPSNFLTGLKHTRQRSSSWGTTFYSTTVVPASSRNEALSSLITSLTSISDANRVTPSDQRPKTAQPPENGRGCPAGRIGSPSGAQLIEDEQSAPANTSVSDEEYCPPPVAGYSTINAVRSASRPKTSTSGKIPRRFKDKNSQQKLESSILRTKPTANTAKSARTLRSPDSALSLPRTSHGDESVASLSLSTHSKLSRTRSPLKMFFPPDQMSPGDLPYDQSLHSRIEGFHGTPSSSLDKDRDHLRFSAFVHLNRISMDRDRRDSDNKTLSSMSPSNRMDLSENLVPSRRSSLRSGPRRSSRSSKDLKRLNIDQELIEENHETVQRIRELQQAKEKRQHDIRKEARRSEKASKRTSLPQPGPSSLLRAGSTRSSWHSKATGTPEHEELSKDATATPSDNPRIPSHVHRAVHPPSTPNETSFPTGSGLRLNLSPTPSLTPSASSPHRHRKRLSGSIRRSPSVRQSFTDEAREIEGEVESFLASPRFTQKIRHPLTGRTIVFSEVGDPDGFVVLCCVGMGITRYVTSFYHEIAKFQKLRIITPDRPGVGMTDPMPEERSTPLAWVDDVAAICSSLSIDKFSLLAHSAGAIYALATALKMPQYVRGRIHLLGPWIPPSQLAISGMKGELKVANLPTSHKILSFLPTSFMKAANSRFLSATSASLEPKTKRDLKKDILKASEMKFNPHSFDEEPSLSKADMAKSHGPMLATPDESPLRLTLQNLTAYEAECVRQGTLSLSPVPPRVTTLSPPPTRARSSVPARTLSPQARDMLYNAALTHRTWSLATLDANPASDLITCLERRRPIGFRYTDITRAVVIHHGAKDGRVPVENVRWLSGVMKRCELRVLENEGHGLMASAEVMSDVLGEMGREWEEWCQIAKERELIRQKEDAEEQELLRQREKINRRGYPRW